MSLFFESALRTRPEGATGPDGMMSVSPQILDKVVRSYGRFCERIAHIPEEKCARDVLDADMVQDQVHVFCETTGVTVEALRGKRILEIGSGLGNFATVTRRDCGCESVGIEPADQGFDTSLTIAQEILAECGSSREVIVDAKGEHMPFADDPFDFVFSSRVLEHTIEPRRVLRPGGYMQFVFPKYASFFEGHYAAP